MVKRYVPKAVPVAATVGVLLVALFLARWAWTPAVSLGSNASVVTCNTPAVAREAWNSPDNLAEAGRRPPPLHMDDGSALSPDGHFLAIAMTNEPVNVLDIVDLRTKRGWRLSHPSYLVKLAQPAFSPDGQLLAYVVSPPTYAGVCEIWITPLGGGVTRVISAFNRCYQHPSFSSDGKRLAFFRDIDPDPSPTGKRCLSEEFAGFHAYSMFSYDLDRGEERRLAPQAFSNVMKIFESPLGKGFFYNVMFPREYAKRPEDGADMWIRLDNCQTSEYLNRDGAIRAYYVSASDFVPACSKSVIAPNKYIDNGEMISIANNGDILLDGRKSEQTGPLGVSLKLAVIHNHELRILLSESEYGYNQSAMSFDGSKVAFVTTGSLALPAHERMMAPPNIGLIDMRSGLRDITPWSNFKFQDSVVILNNVMSDIRNYNDKTLISAPSEVH